MRGERWRPDVVERLAGDECSREFIRVVAEGLGDRFEPALCDRYAELFSAAMAAVDPEVDAPGLIARYRRIREPRVFDGRRVRNVFVLSRVTLGADVAITSVILDAAQNSAFPEARIFFLGSRKAWELFEGDSRIEFLTVDYPRGGSLRERMMAGRELGRLVSQPESITIDPDSRLTQLGLVPGCAESDYFFFESRGFGGDGEESLGTLSLRWAKETFGVENAKAYIAPTRAGAAQAAITVSLGVGENPTKRIREPFERELMAALARRSETVLVDRGIGGEEAERVERATAGLTNVAYWEGSFAGFADAIARSRLYVGYDSAGQHVAAASGVPLLSVFAGYPTPRMAARWRPSGPGPIEVVRVEDSSPEAVLRRTVDALKRLGMA